MANEAEVRGGLAIRVGSLQYQSNPTSFKADVSVAKGPTPGLVLADTDGTNVSLALLGTPGFCWLMNLDAANYVEYGVHDGSLFHPLGELGPGEFNTIKLSRNLGVEEDMPGTGTSAVVNSLCLRANTADCYCIVDAFER